MYKKDAAAFMGTDKFEVESQGTQFQRNAAAFIGTDMPASGERPFKIDKNAKPAAKTQGGSYLNEQRLKEHVSNLLFKSHCLIVFAGEQHAEKPPVQEEHEEIPRPAFRHHSLKRTSLHCQQTRCFHQQVKYIA